MAKKIRFIKSRTEFNYAEHGVGPASHFTPKWYKEIPPTVERPGVTGRGTTTVKRCLPYYDALTSGYILSTSFDIEVKNVEDKKILSTTADTREVLVELDPPYRSEGMPVPDDHHPWIWRVTSMTSPVTPSGCSVLITHPINRPDLPFTAISGVLESDKLVAPLTVNLYIKNSFEGVIPAGTPIAQIFPFIRTDWYHEVEEHDENLFNRSRWGVTSTIYRAYQSKFWVKKNYK
jgi:hypothetical protein